MLLLVQPKNGKSLIKTKVYVILIIETERRMQSVNWDRLHAP